MFAEVLVVIKGGGDLGSAVAHRLHRCGFPVAILERRLPTAVRRTVAFAEAVYVGEVTVEGVTARCVANAEEVWPTIHEGIIPVLIDPDGLALGLLKPTVVVDAIMAKRNLGTRKTDAPIVIALGPGFYAGVDAHAVIETSRGHHLSRVILEGTAEPNTGEPGCVGGVRGERVIRAPCAGTLQTVARIGQTVEAGQIVGRVDGEPVRAGIGGVLRGLAHDGIRVQPGTKLGDIDPRGNPEYCFSISDKARAVSGGVLEAILLLLRKTDELDRHRGLPLPGVR